ncbi:RHS repeat-associated core domain-containing protein [Chryseobacterium sp. JAH]|uniref:RHS repeat-associated core domain-containing protein n=1 Tax=Chryseobacterium sp. JAH TaxID=1742858 RepID=UPI0007413276|nr:RHS repeat-associated core domain-containing protein [Chryseobacterium sp. JAH]KUJ50908.1 hypothetical protein AR685_11775 [Chryseobacterium sp. JAH]
MTIQQDKGISNIAYNLLDLPSTVTQKSNAIQYLYRAPRKTSSGVTRDYVDGFQYENGVLKFVPTSQGYFNFENNKYIYHYTDHLGNIRLSYTKNGSAAAIIEESNFYPYGMKQENTLQSNPAYNYEHSGKEFQKETGWSDFGARMYMADIGRWGVIDPLAETTTRINPYNYALDNPISFIDPDGRKAMALMDPVETFFPAGGYIDFMMRGGDHTFGSFQSFLEGNSPFGYMKAFQAGGSGGGGGGSYATFGQTPAYAAFMSGQTSSITNANGYLYWNTLDPANANGMLDDGSIGGVTRNRVNVGNSGDTSWDAYKNWADWGSTAMGGTYEYIAAQRTAFYNSGSWVDNLGNVRSVAYAGRAVDSQIGLRSSYVRTTAMYGKYAKRAGVVGHVISAGQIGYGVYEDKGKFGKNAQVATVGVAGGMAGAAAGAWLGAKILAPIGGGIGVLFFGVGAAPGTAIGGAVGGIIGGIVGGIYGGDYAEQAAENWIK